MKKIIKKSFVRNLLIAMLMGVFSLGLGTTVAYGSSAPTIVKNLSVAKYSRTQPIALNFCFTHPNPGLADIDIEWIYNFGEDRGAINETATGFTTFPIGCTAGTSNTYNLNLDEARDGIYQVWVTASDGHNRKSTSIHFFTYDTKAPTNPSLSGSSKNGSVSLSWTKSDDSGSGFKHYLLYRNGKIFRTITSRSSNSHTDNLADNDSYSHSYKVVAVDNAGNTNGDSANATFTYTPPTSNDTSNTEDVAKPKEPAPNNSQVVPPITTEPKPDEATPPNQEVKGTQEVKAKITNWVPIAAGLAVTLGVVGIMLFLILKKKEARHTVLFETLSNNNPAFAPSRDEPDNNTE